MCEVGLDKTLYIWSLAKTIILVEMSKAWLCQLHTFDKVFEEWVDKLYQLKKKIKNSNLKTKVSDVWSSQGPFQIRISRVCQTLDVNFCDFNTMSEVILEVGKLPTF